MTPDERRQAGIVALRNVQVQREAAFRPLCQDCKFGPVRATDRDRCEHFAHWQISPDRKLRIPETTAHARSDEGLCGPEASLFKPYSRWRLVPRWLARQKPETAAIFAAWAVIGALAALGALAISIRGAW